MEQWKLPELRQSVGYQLHVPGGNPFQQITVPAHAPTPTPTPTSSGADRNANTFPVPTLDSDSRLKRIKKNHEIIKSRFQVRLDKQERKNRALSARMQELKQCEAFLSSLHEIEGRVMFAESFGKFLEMSVQGWESAIGRYNLEGTVEAEGSDEEEGEEEDEEEYEEEYDGEDEGESEEDEKDEKEGTEDSEEDDSGEKQESESDCSDDEDDY